MNNELESRLRDIWHVTSLDMAEVILSSGKIWGMDGDGAANFHPNQDSKNIPGEPPEVSLNFRWEGNIKLVGCNYHEELMPGVMYVYVTNDINCLSELTVSDVMIWTCKIPRGTNNGLTCIDAVRYGHLQYDERLSKLLTACRRMKSIVVPTTSEINQMKNNLVDKSLRQSVIDRFLNVFRRN